MPSTMTIIVCTDRSRLIFAASSIWYVRKGWPEHKKVCPDLIKPYWEVRHELSEHEGMLSRGEQIG